MLLLKKVTFGKSTELGVFTSKVLLKDSVVEETRCLIIPKKDTNNILALYTFEIPKNKRKVALPLGFGAMYNHSENPNVDYAFTHEGNLLFWALRDIQKGEQLFINYGYDPITGEELA